MKIYSSVSEIIILINPTRFEFLTELKLKHGHPLLMKILLYRLRRIRILVTVNQMLGSECARKFPTLFTQRCLKITDLKLTNRSDMIIT